MTGTIGYATNQGLGVLTKQFYDHGIIDLVCVQSHTTRKNHYDWYPHRVTKEELLVGCDRLLFFETPFDWKIILEARKKGIKTILVVMYECTRLHYQPDEIWSPSLLDKQYYPDSKLVQIPVDVPWKLRKKAKVFVHNAGNLGLGGRNGTKELLEAMQYVKSPIKLILRSQVPLKVPDDPRIDYREGTFDDIWSEGDVFVFPEKFNGLSLPIQEAYASGMLVMASDRFPNNTYLPTEPLIPVSGYHKEHLAVPIDVAELSPEIIAGQIDSWYDRDITTFSLIGKEWGEKNSYTSCKKQLVTMVRS